MYAQKYGEEFAPHLPVLVTDVWNLLVSCGKQLKYDLVGSFSLSDTPPLSFVPFFSLAAVFYILDLSVIGHILRSVSQLTLFVVSQQCYTVFGSSG